MSLPIYKPNSKTTGSAFTFNFGPDKRGGDVRGEIALYVSAVLQASWNQATKKGSFRENAKNPAKTINIKLNEFEIGGLLNAIKRRVEFKGFHSSGESTKVQFSFTPQVIDNAVVGFFFSILRNGKDKFNIPITVGEAETLSSFLDFGLKTLFANRFRVQFQGKTQVEPARTPPPQSRTEQVLVEETVEEENPFETDAGGAASVEEVDSTGDDQGEVVENPFG